jgi:hypothetical protein
MDILTFFSILLRLSGGRHPEQQENKGREKTNELKIVIPFLNLQVVLETCEGSEVTHF